MARLTVSRKGTETLKAIEGITENELRVLQLLNAEKAHQNIVSLNATAHQIFQIDNTLDIVESLKSKGFIIELSRDR